MSNKKRKLLVAISALVSTVNSVQNGLGDFEKISEIIKIKFILKELIKKGEKMGKKNFEKKQNENLEIKNITKNTFELNMIEEYKKNRNLKDINLKNGKNLIENLKEKFKDFQEIYNLISVYLVDDRISLYFDKNEIHFIFSEKLLTTNIRDSSSFEEIDDYIIENSKKNNILFKITTDEDLEKLNRIGFLSGGYYWYQKEEQIYSGYYIRYGSFHRGFGVYSIEKFFKKLDNRLNSKLESNKLKIFETILNYNLLASDIITTKDLQKKFENLSNKYKIYKDYISYIKEDGEIVFNIESIISSIDKKGENLFDGIKIKYKENSLNLKSEEIYKDKNIFYFENGEREEVSNNKLGEDKSVYYFKNGDIEERIYQEGILNGKNILRFSNGDIEERTYKNGVLDGEASLTYKNRVLEKRIYRNGVLDGKATLTYKNGNIETREYRNGILEGKRILTYKNGDIEEREYKNGILSEESTYYFKNGDIEKRNYKDGVLKGKSTYTHKNGDIEEREYKNGILSEESTYYFKNGDIEERKTKNGVLEGKSIYIFTDGSIEEREYKNGILQGEVVYKKDGYKRKYLYTDGKKEEMPVLKYYLSIDKERINTDDYQEDILLDPNVGHWNLKEQDKKELKEILGKNVYKRDPKEDINQGGIVAIDFGTKSTVVVYQKDSENILPMRISGDKLNREVRNTDYENPTVIEFRDIDKFLKDYNAKVGRPDTKWQDITVSHTAFGNLTEVSSEYFDSIISDIKQWTASKNQKIILVDRKGKEILLPPYLELKEKSKDYLDPVEIYAYYIGSYINNMINGIYLEYYLSFPVTYEKAIRERILKSFEKGIQKSLPIEIQEDKDLMKKFRVRHGANEPAAFAVCALSKLEIEPKNEEDKVYYGVFDFGGGTTDFDFGIWKYSEEEDLYDYELEHFSAGGERYLGGENILKELAYKVFTDNSSNLRKSQIQYTRPEWCDEIIGEETLVSQTKQARQNSTKVAKELRGIWENTTTERLDYISVNLFNSLGEVNAGFKLDVKEDNLKNLIKEKIEKGIKNFFIKMEDAFKGEDVKEINIFLAGNSCKHPFVEEIFNRYIEEKKDKFKINIYNTKMFDDLKETNKVNPTAKTGVAFGLIYSRNSGRIKVTSRDEKANISNEINFKFYIGNNRRNKFNCIISPNSNYDEYKFFGIVKSDIFELYYSTSPEAQTNEMKSSEAKIKRVNLKKDYDEEDRYRIYLKANKSDELSYAIVKEEKDIETKKFVEEGEISLN